MAEFKFFCPQCGQHVQCDTSYSGTQIDCPICKQTILVPQVPRAVLSGQSPVQARSRILRNALVITAAVVVLAGLVICGWYGYSKIRIYSSRGHLPPGLVSLWSGEGNANDSVGGNNGTMTGSAKFGPGKMGQGFVFNGRKDSGVTLGNPASLQLQDFTIEAWIKRGSDRVVSYGSGGNASLFDSGWGGGYLFGMAANGELFFDRLGDVVPQTGPEITDTNFHHVALTKSGSTVVFYLDGTAYQVPSYTTTFTFPSSIGFGYQSDTRDQSFLGTLDEVGFFNRALSASEIQAIYSAE
jgi:ribosomal protein S27E